MHLTLVRHATLLLRVAGQRILVDPQLDPKDARDPVPNTFNPRRNPLVELPEPAEALVERDPRTSREHMATVRRTAHEALGELRRMLDVLREDQPDYAPQPQLASIGELVATVRETGQEIELDEEYWRHAAW